MLEENRILPEQEKMIEYIDFEYDEKELLSDFEMVKRDPDRWLKIDPNEDESRTFYGQDMHGDPFPPYVKELVDRIESLGIRVGYKVNFQESFYGETERFSRIHVINPSFFKVGRIRLCNIVLPAVGDAYTIAYRPFTVEQKGDLINKNTILQLPDRHYGDMLETHRVVAKPSKPILLARWIPHNIEVMDPHRVTLHFNPFDLQQNYGSIKRMFQMGGHRVWYEPLA